MNIWIIYDSKYGNSKQIAETLGGFFKAGNEVHVYYAKDISPKAMANSSPNALLFGGPLRCGSLSFTMKGWAENLTKELINKGITLKKVGVWGTHLKDPLPSQNIEEKFLWNGMKLKWKALMDSVPAEKHMIDVQGFIVGEIKGPLEPGWQEIASQFAVNFMNLL